MAFPTEKPPEKNVPTSKEIVFIVFMSSLALGINACADIANEKLGKKASSIELFSINQDSASNYPQED